MKTLFVANRVTDLDRSLDFYTTLGNVELGRVDGGDGTHLVILKFPGEPAAPLELVHRPAGGRVDVGSGVDHLAIQVDTLAASLERPTDASTRAALPGWSRPHLSECCAPAWKRPLAEANAPNTTRWRPWNS